MSDPLEKSIIIDILTTLESQGLDAAIAKFKSLEAQTRKNTVASGENAESMERVRSRVSGATTAIAGMERVAAGGVGALDGMTQAAKGMMAVLGTAGKSMVWVTVASAIVAAIVGLIQKFQEAREAAAEAEKELADLKVTGAMEGLGKYRAALKEATDQANALAAANRGLEDAKLKLGLADIEARKAAELKDPKLTDDERREIELRYAKEEIQLRNDAAEKRAAFEADQAKKRIETNAAEIKGLQETRAEIAGPAEENKRWLMEHGITKDITDADVRGAALSAAAGAPGADIATMMEAQRRQRELAAQAAAAKPKLAELDAQIRSKERTGEALKLDSAAAGWNVDVAARERQADEARWAGMRAAQTHAVRKRGEAATTTADAEAAAAAEAALTPADRLRRAQGMVSDQRAGWGGRPGGDVGRATGAAARAAIAEAGAAIAAGGDDAKIVGQLMSKLKEMGAVIFKGNSVLAAELDAMDGVLGELQAQVATLKSQTRHGRTP